MLIVEVNCWLFEGIIFSGLFWNKGCDCILVDCILTVADDYAIVNLCSEPMLPSSSKSLTMTAFTTPASSLCMVVSSTTSINAVAGSIPSHTFTTGISSVPGSSAIGLGIWLAAFVLCLFVIHWLPHCHPAVNNFAFSIEKWLTVICHSRPCRL